METHKVSSRTEKLIHLLDENCPEQIKQRDSVEEFIHWMIEFDIVLVY